MLQHDISEVVASSSRPVYRAAAGEPPLWLHGWRALRSSSIAALAPLSGLARTLHRWRREAITVRELSALRDRELRDIGIERDDIPSIAKSLAKNNAAPRPATRPTARPAAILKLVPRQEPAQPCCS